MLTAPARYFGSSFLAGVAIVLAAVIFSVDAFTPLSSAIAVLYSVVILLCSRFLNWRGLVMLALGCTALTILAYVIGHGVGLAGQAFLRLLVSVAAIGATTFLAVEDGRAAARLRERAGLLDLTRDTIFVRDMQDVITYWNAGAAAAYGWQARDVVGKMRTHDLLHTVFPAPLDQINAELFAADRWEGELVHTRADGTQMTVSSRWALQRDDRGRPSAILETNNDITEKKRAIEALRQSEAQWREVFEHNPVMYFMVDAAGTVLSVNGFGAGQLGYAVSELIGRSLLELFGEQERQFMRENLAACVAAPGSALSWETRARHKDGSTLWVRENAKAVRRAGELIVLVACEDVTQRKRDEDRLRRSKAYLAEAQRLSQVGSFGWEIKTGRLVWSEETYRIFGCDGGTNPTLELVVERVHPEDRAAVQQIINNVKRGGTGFEHEYRLLMPDGAVKHVHVLARANADLSGEVEFVGAVMDVTASKEAENRILQIIDAVPALIWRARADNTVDYINERLRQYIGLTRHRGSYPEWRSEIHPADAGRAKSIRRAAMADNTPYELIFRLRRVDGEYRWVLSRGVPLLDQAGNVLAWYGCVTDIHDRKLAEDDLLKAQADLAHVTRVTTLGELSASIAHEVNQPLAAIVTNGEVSLQLLESEVPDVTEVRDAVAAMVNDGRRASDVIRRLRTLTAKAELQKVELNLNDIVVEVVPLVRDEVVGKGVSLRLDLAPELPVVLGDRIQLQQVIINLLVNAVEAMTSVDGRARELVVASQRYGSGQVLIAVRDSGVGIDPGQATGLFEAFYTTKPHGMGMGLSICRSIVESHGGTIWASANDGFGATFQFALPTRLEQAA